MKKEILNQQKPHALGKLEVSLNINPFANYFWRGGSVKKSSLNSPVTRYKSSGNSGSF